MSNYKKQQQTNKKNNNKRLDLFSTSVQNSWKCERINFLYTYNTIDVSEKATQEKVVKIRTRSV